MIFFNFVSLLCTWSQVLYSFYVFSQAALWRLGCILDFNIWIRYNRRRSVLTDRAQEDTRLSKVLPEVTCQETRWKLSELVMIHINWSSCCHKPSNSNTGDKIVRNLLLHFCVQVFFALFSSNIQRGCWSLSWQSIDLTSRSQNTNARTHTFVLWEATHWNLQII